jgi:hypothetical protein
MSLTLRALLYAPFFLAGLLSIAYGIYLVLLARKSAEWPKTEGTVTRFKITQDGGPDESNLPAAEVRYRYSVDDKQYSGDLVAFGTRNMHTNLGLVERLARAYPKGTRVQVAYDPENPGRAVLEPGATAWAWVICGIGCGFLSVPGALIFCFAP